ATLPKKPITAENAAKSVLYLPQRSSRRIFDDNSFVMELIADSVRLFPILFFPCAISLGDPLLYLRLGQSLLAKPTLFFIFEKTPRRDLQQAERFAHGSDRLSARKNSVRAPLIEIPIDGPQLSEEQCQCSMRIDSIAHLL